MELKGCSRSTSSVFRNSKNVSNASSARMFVMSCETNRLRNLQDRSFLIRIASLTMHPLDTLNRLKELKDVLGIGYCNITKCCTEFCPEDITITDNAIIPLKERVAGAFYDPLAWLWRSPTFVSK